MNTQPSTSQQPSTKLWGEQIHMSGFVYDPQTIFQHTQGKVLLPMNSNPSTVNKQVNNQRCEDEN